MQESEPSSIEDSNPEAEDVDRFEKSLRELRELRSQLHYAAEYCENAFLNSKQKQKVMKSTKDYISNAMVTVVDHLGSASANLECLISCRVDPTHAEFRINGLQHRLLTCREYGRTQDLANVRWSAKFPTYHAHYTSRLTPNLQRPKALVRNAAYLVAVGPTNESKIEANGSAPLVRFTESTLAIKNLNSRLSSGFEFSAAALPAKDTSSVLSKPRIPSFRSHAKVRRFFPFGRSAVRTNPNGRAHLRSTLFISFADHKLHSYLVKTLIVQIFGPFYLKINLIFSP